VNTTIRMTGDVRVLIVEDQGIMAAFLQTWLAGFPRFACAGVAKSGEEALALLEAARPDVALVDFQLPLMDGLQFVQMARQVRPQLRALILTTLADPLTLARVREAGVEGYVEKDASPDLVAQALEAVADGRHFYSDLFKRALAREDTKALGLAKILSRREQQVLAHVLAGKTSRETGELLGLSARTVEFHRSNLMTKLDASNLADLVATVRKRGWTRAMTLAGSREPSA
jgi:DNA-binding NarL/FixJ family response regulator